MKILLLGGEGFIGRNLADSMSGKFEHYSLGRTPSPFRTISKNFIKKNLYCENIGEFFDVYVHLIDNKLDIEQEMYFLKNVNPDAHIILFSSAVVYANPTSIYGLRKSALEKIYTDHCKKLTILRLFNTYGKYQIPYRQGSLVANILYNHINNIPIEINNMDIRRDFIFAEDIGRYVEFVITSQLYGTYDLATGKMHSLGELCNAVQCITSSTLNVVDHKRTDIACPTANKTIPCNIKPTELSWGLEGVFAFFRDNNAIIKSLVS
ncbi:MAG: NAD(P)-dependent oxidoreductase [Holosporaceae bacterium]|jgi:nucleoside-diphosphate-sugar epimerase|nr:NAD(P)-dependent oxidoreductase [Holosporaceae bacterium]